MFSAVSAIWDWIWANIFSGWGIYTATFAGWFFILWVLDRVFDIFWYLRH